LQQDHIQKAGRKGKRTGLLERMTRFKNLFGATGDRRSGYTKPPLGYGTPKME